MNDDLIHAMEDILDVPRDSLNEASDFRSLPDWDSLAALSVMVKIEDIYKKVIDPSIFKQCRTIGELLAAISAS